jgi:cytidine deaminase
VTGTIKVTGTSLTADDAKLIEIASDLIRKHYRNDRQNVGAALRTRTGRVFTGVNLDTHLRRMAVCAEAVVLGRAISEAGDHGIDTIVAVRHPDPDTEERNIAVVSPCGSCRELIWDYDANARVIVPGKNGPAIATIAELLPNKYIRAAKNR